MKKEELIEESPSHMKLYVGNTRCVSDFEKIKEIGEGTFGTVCIFFAILSYS